MNAVEIELLMKNAGSIGGYVMESNQMFAQLIRETEYGAFDRADWQCINYLYYKPTLELNILNDFLAYFEPNETNRKDKVDRFFKMGIIQLEQETVTLTNFGKTVFRAVHQAQKEMLVACFKNIHSDEYRIAIKVLKQMMQNMQAFLPEK